MMGLARRREIRFAVWLAAAACAGAVAAGQEAPPLQAERGAGSLADRIATILAPPAVARDHWGIQVTTLDGAVLYSLNEGQMFQPASDAKLFTTAAALALLGPNQRFTTRVQYDSVGDSSTIGGDVVIVGEGDGSFNDRDLPYRVSSEAKDAAKQERILLRYLAEFADAIAVSGVKRIHGDIVGDDTVFPWEPYAPDWASDDTMWGYGAPVSGLSVNDNEIQITVTPGRAEKERPAVRWQIGMPPYYALDVSGLVTGAVGSGGHVQMEREAGSKTVRVYGSIAIGAKADVEEIAIADPAEFAAVALKAQLEARGVAVDGTARARHRSVMQGTGFLSESMRPLGTVPDAISPGASAFLTGIVDCYNTCPKMMQHTSATVEDDVVVTDKMSLNLHAELMLRHLGRQYGECSGTSGGNSCAAEGARVVRQFLVNAGIDGKDFVFFDGSGLSGDDLVTPRATAKLLLFAAHGTKTGEAQPWFAAWKASLPVGGVDGTLASRFTSAPLKGHVFAKTGTLGEARALSGYLDAASGRTVIFSIFVGDHLPGTTDDRDAMDRIVAAIQAVE